MTSEPDIGARIERARRDLLDLSLRNPLLNYRPLRARGVEVVGERVPQVFDALVNDGRPMTFRSVGGDDRSGTPDAAREGTVVVPSANRRDRVLQTAETADALHQRLLNTYRLARTSIEETGVNVLFLGLGMLRWYESESSRLERLAPLVLVPVRLERTGVRDRFGLAYTGDDLGANGSLREKARTDFGIDLPGQDVLEPPDDRDVDVAGYVARIEEVVRRSAPRWEVESDRIVLGFFSFSKLAMYKDLEPPAVIDNEIITALFGDHGFSEPRSTIGDRENLDDRLPPREVHHVLDVDSSQALAIHDAARGRNMVIQGPPGTGKSQSITNILAEAVARGKRTLFVCEKMAALEVVKRRLDGIGLGDACLELHSHKTNKRETLDELGRTLRLSAPTTDGSDGDLLEHLSRTEAQLNDYAAALHDPEGNSGLTPYDAFGELLARDYQRTANPIARRELPDVADWSGADFERRRDVVEDLRLRLHEIGVPSRHPFWGSRLRVVLPNARTALRARIGSTLGGLARLTTACRDLAEATQRPCPEAIPAARDLVTASLRAVDGPDTAGLDLQDPGWESDGGTIRELVEAGVRWQRMRGQRIRAAADALQALTDRSDALADAMRLDRPASVDETREVLAAARRAAGAPDADGLDLHAPQWTSHGERIRQLLNRGLRWRQLRAEHDAVLLPESWDADLQPVRLVLNTDGRSLWRRLFSSDYRRARNRLAAAMRGGLPRGTDRQVSLIDAIGEEQQLRAEIDGRYADVVPAIEIGRASCRERV